MHKFGAWYWQNCHLKYLKRFRFWFNESILLRSGVFMDTDILSRTCLKVFLLATCLLSEADIAHVITWLRAAHQFHGTIVISHNSTRGLMHLSHTGTFHNDAEVETVLRERFRMQQAQILPRLHFETHAKMCQTHRQAWRVCSKITILQVKYQLIIWFF